MPVEAWRAINELHIRAVKDLPGMVRRPTAGVGGEIVAHCHAITGILDGTMSHGPAYQFVRLGRSLERPDVVAFLLLDGQFPRAVIHCVKVLDDAVANLPRGDPAREKIATIRRSLEAIDPTVLDHETVHRFIDELQLEFADLHAAIFETWLNPMRIGQAPRMSIKQQQQ